jgi:hypothetical protein
MTCSWCGKAMSSGQTSLVHSHGICQACKDRLLQTEIPAARELRAYERERDRQTSPVGREERTLSTLYGVPLSLSQVL